MHLLNVTTFEFEDFEDDELEYTLGSRWAPAPPKVTEGVLLPPKKGLNSHFEKIVLPRRLF